MTYTYTTLDDPLGVGPYGTVFYGINDAGQIVGDYWDGSVAHGFLYSGGTYTTLSDPLGTTTYAFGVNNLGQVVGKYFDGSGAHIFIYSSGTYTTLKDPYGAGGSLGSNGLGINDSDQIVGSYIDIGGVRHGFLYNNGSYTTLDDPLAGATGTEANGINDAGQIVGEYWDSNNVLHGFLYSGGTYTTLNTSSAYDINVLSQIVGVSFLYSGGTYAPLADPLATSGTFPLGINNAGQIVGYYTNSSGQHGFLAADASVQPPSDPISPYIFDNTVFDQTSDTAPLVPWFYFFSIGATFLTAGDYVAATASYPGPGSPQTLALIAPTEFDFSSSAFTSFSTLQAAYPFGTYTVTGAGNQISSTNSVSYQANYFTSTVPAVTNYSSLNGFNPANDFTVHYNSFTPNPQVTTGFTFLTIWNANTHQVIFQDSFQSPSSTTALIPADTLSPNTNYTFELDFSDRLIVGASTQGFDMRTDGSFTTGPIFTNQPPVIDLAHSTTGRTINERPNVTGSLALDIANGAIAFTDADLNDRPSASVTHQKVTWQDSLGHAFQLTNSQIAAFENAFLIVPEAGNTNNGKIDWGYTIGDSALDFLGLGETITITSTVEVDDGHGGKIDQNVTVTVNGADDAPTSLAKFASVEKSGTLSLEASHSVLSGSSDPDLHDVLTVYAVNGLASNVGHSIAGTYGSLTLNFDGGLTYTPSKNISFPGSQATDHFSYSITDGHGDVVTSSLDIGVLKNGTSSPISPTQGLVITPHWDTSVFSLSPAQQASFENAVDAAISILETTFSNPVKLDINFGWGEVGGSPITGNSAAGKSDRSPILTNYSAIYAELVSDPLYDKTAFKSLPFPTSAGDGQFFASKPFYVANAEAKALGLTPLPGSDGDVGLNSFGLAGFDAFTFDPNQRSMPGKIDAIGVLIHEITEVMGRVSDIGHVGTNLLYTPLDLFRYSSAGVHSSPQGPGFFSENGKSLLMPFNNPTLTPGDAADWAGSISGDSFGGWELKKELAFSPTDHLVMSALDWHLV